MRERFSGMRYGDLKKQIAEMVIQHLEPIQQRYREITADPALRGFHSSRRSRKSPADRDGNGGTDQKPGWGLIHPEILFKERQPVHPLLNTLRSGHTRTVSLRAFRYESGWARALPAPAATLPRTSSYVPASRGRRDRRL